MKAPCRIVVAVSNEMMTMQGEACRIRIGVGTKASGCPSGGRKEMTEEQTENPKDQR